MLSVIMWEMSDGRVGVPYLAARLSDPHCHKPDTYNHYRHFCLEPTVMTARQKHKDLLPAAIYASALKKTLKRTTAEAHTAMYILDA